MRAFARPLFVMLIIGLAVAVAALAVNLGYHGT